MISVSFITTALSVLTVLAQVIILFLVLTLVFRHKKALNFLGDKALLLAFIVALVATMGSLFFSEIAGYEPCKLCWFQRIFMYPQAILLGLALWKKDFNIATYSLVLSVIGGLIAAYNYFIQMNTYVFNTCSSINSCSQRIVFHFGYITIATMSLSAFLLIISLMIILKNKNKSENH